MANGKYCGYEQLQFTIYHSPITVIDHYREIMMNDLLPSGLHHYQITLEGHLDECWSDCFDGLTMTTRRQNGGITILTGPVADQAALRGLLNQIWDFNLALIAVERLD
jgi:hypothetical protein